MANKIAVRKPPKVKVRGKCNEDLLKHTHFIQIDYEE